MPIQCLLCVRYSSECFTYINSFVDCSQIPLPDIQKEFRTKRHGKSTSTLGSLQNKPLYNPLFIGLNVQRITGTINGKLKKLSLKLGKL